MHEWLLPNADSSSKLNFVEEGLDSTSEFREKAIFGKKNGEFAEWMHKVPNRTAATLLGGSSSTAAGGRSDRFSTDCIEDVRCVSNRADLDMHAVRNGN